MKSIQKEFKYKDIDIKYMIIKNRIKNVYIHIKNGHIIVKSPIYVSDKKLEELVNKKSEWIYKKLKECEKRENRDTNILENKYLYILGKKINVKFIVKNVVINASDIIPTIANIFCTTESPSNAPYPIVYKNYNPVSLTISVGDISLLSTLYKLNKKFAETS